ncbi:hypothetical protein OIU77_008321 [Salix suchowensis]|uniref:Phospholipase A1 n=1 Tax=Salix suchowensis TaxID=1278906 RepID=A0ABQ9AKK5_9ROSI|nr:hypothetical protein OIU77_008321 [Salix suchowensis]
MASIAENWKDFSGARNWAGLLDHPLNTEFRRYLIHYGERVDAIVDAFNDVTASDSYGLSRYPAEDFFMNVNLQNGNPFKYQVTKYFYLQSEAIAECSYWISKANNPKVHRGFHNAYVAYGEKFKYNKASARTQVRAEVRKLVDMYDLKGEEVSITVAGHSLGAALATLNGMDMVANGWNKPSGSDKGFPVTVFAYASPSVGDQGFQDVFNGLTNDLHVLRIRNLYDPVPYGMKELFPDYRDVGEELEIDSSKSPYLKRPGPIAESHYLQLYLHAIAGYQGKEEEFQLVVDRDISLLNKPLDVLADKYKIPPKWWAVKNNGMIQMDNGFWKLNDYVPEPPSDDEEIIASLENGNLSPA